MHLTPNMYKIVTLNASAQKIITLKCIWHQICTKSLLCRQMLRRSLLENVFDTKYVQNHYFADKCSGNHYFKMLLMPNMYKTSLWRQMLRNHIRWVWNCWKQSRSIIFTWQTFAGFHTEATSSGHWGNVSLTKYYKGTYQDDTAVDLHVDKEGGVGRWMHVLTIVDNIKEYMKPPPKWTVGEEWVWGVKGGTSRGVDVGSGSLLLCWFWLEHWRWL